MQRAYVKVEVKPNIDKELRQKATATYLNSHIQEALKQERYDDAKDYIDLANFLHISINPNLIKEYKSANTPLKKHLREGKSFVKGFIFGKSDDSLSLAGSVTSDFTFVGDIRDIYKEGSKYIEDKDYDKITLSLATIGVALSASTIASLGTTAPIKASASILKAANKSRKLTRGFKALLKNKLERSVDLKVLKRVDLSSIKSIEKNSKVFIKSINPKPIEAIAKDLNKIKKNSSTIDTLKLMKYIDNEKDLKAVLKLSNKYKKNTKGVLKVLGKSALRGSKFVLKKSAKFIYYLYGLVASIIGFIVSLVGFIFTVRRVV